MKRSRVPFRAILVIAAFGLLAWSTPCPAAPDAVPAASPLTLCLDSHADDTAVYPLVEVPANHRVITVVFALKATDSFQKLTHSWIAVDVGDVAPANSEVARADLVLGDRKRGVLRFRLGRDLPIGKYRLDVLADEKPWASLSFPVVASKPVVPLEKPEHLLPLVVGTNWTHSFLVEAGPVIKKMTVTGAVRGDDGKWRSTATFRVAALEDAGARVEILRNGVLVNEEWWRLDADGLGITRERAGGAETSFEPPVPILRLPLESPVSFTYKPADGSFERAYKMWGPLRVRGPKGPTSGWVVYYIQSTPRGRRTVETHVVPGVGIVRGVAVESAGAHLLTRIENQITGEK
jgi:hypothetical protein